MVIPHQICTSLTVTHLCGLVKSEIPCAKSDTQCHKTTIRYERNIDKVSNFIELRLEAIRKILAMSYEILII